jgi:hypothetical protein
MDIQKQLREKYENLQKGKSNDGGGGDTPFMQLQDGDNFVRVLPSKDPENVPFYAETALHYLKPLNKVVHCTRKIDKNCPICDLYYEIWGEVNAMQDNTSKEGERLKSVARAIKPNDRYFVNVVNRADESVKILSAGKKLFTKFMDTIFDVDYGDITDLENGYDYRINKENVAGTNGQTYANYDKSNPRPKSCKAGTDAQVASWMESLHDLHGQAKYPEYEVLKDMASSLRLIAFPERPVVGNPVNSSEFSPTTIEDDNELADYLG